MSPKLEREGVFPGGADAHESKPLLVLGREIAEARDRMSLTQMALAGFLGLSQNYIARLEKGDVPDPGREVLAAISDRLNLNYDRLIAILVEGKYGISKDKISVLHSGPVTLDRLAEWEKNDVKKVLWVVTPKFIDASVSEFSVAIDVILRERSGYVTFLMPRESVASFNEYRSEFHKNHKNLNVLTLSRGEEAILTNGFVIGDPDDAPRGFIILNDANGSPYLSVEMSPPEAAKKSLWLKLLIDEKSGYTTQGTGG